MESLIAVMQLLFIRFPFLGLSAINHNRKTLIGKYRIKGSDLEAVMSCNDVGLAWSSYSFSQHQNVKK